MSAGFEPFQIRQLRFGQKPKKPYALFVCLFSRITKLKNKVLGRNSVKDSLSQRERIFCFLYFVPLFFFFF